MAKTKYTAKTTEQLENELNELTESATTKIDEFFTSKESIQEHLRFMSQFYNFSVRNTMLIQKQFKGATAVGSFQFWKSKGATVKKGEKGIKILVPTPVHFFKRDEKLVQLKYATEAEKKLIEQNKIPLSKKTFFKVGHVFDYSQTNAREKGLEVSEIFGRFQRNDSIDNDKQFMKAFEQIGTKMGVRFLKEPPKELGTAKGAFYRDLNAIALNPRNTPAEDIQVMIHELAHAALHNHERNQQRGKLLSVPEKEFQAELTAYVVASRYGIEMDNFSIPYLSNWTKDAKLEDKEQLLNEIKQTATDFIETIDAHFEKENLLEKGIEQIGYVEYGALSDAKLNILSQEQLKSAIEATLAENTMRDAYMQQLQPVFEEKTLTEENLKFINQVLGDNIHTFDAAAINEPKALIQWSESDYLKNNTMYRFAEANEKASEIAFDKQHGASEDEMEYYKTRYSVIVPSEEGLQLVKVDRNDLGDGLYSDFENQIYHENAATPEQMKTIENDLKEYYQSQTHAALASELLANKNEQNSKYEIYSSLAAKEFEEKQAVLTGPVMKIHNLKEYKDFKEFGVVNQAEFDESPNQKFTYTIAYPFKNSTKIVSSSFDKTQAINPLHDLEKFGKLPQKELELLSENWHSVLQREEDKYLEKVAPRLREEVKASEANTESNAPVKTKRVRPSKKPKELELER
jgi:hypothetical protein